MNDITKNKENSKSSPSPRWTKAIETKQIADIANCCYALLESKEKDVEHLGRSIEPTQLLINTLNFNANNSPHIAGINATNVESTHLVEKHEYCRVKNKVLKPKIKKHKEVFAAMQQAAKTYESLKNMRDKTRYPQQILIAGIDALREKISGSKQEPLDSVGDGTELSPIRKNQGPKDLNQSLTALQQCAGGHLFKLNNGPNDWETIRTGLLSASDIKTKKTSTHTEHTSEDPGTKKNSSHEEAITDEVRVPHYEPFPDQPEGNRDITIKYKEYFHQYVTSTPELSSEPKINGVLSLNHKGKTSDNKAVTLTTQTRYDYANRSIASTIKSDLHASLEDRLTANVFAVYAFLLSNSENLPNNLFLNVPSGIAMSYKETLHRAIHTALSKLVNKDDPKKMFTVYINGEPEEFAIQGELADKVALKSKNASNDHRGLTGSLFLNESTTQAEIEVNKNKNENGRRMMMKS